MANVTHSVKSRTSFRTATKRYRGGCPSPQEMAQRIAASIREHAARTGHIKSIESYTLNPVTQTLVAELLSNDAA